MEGYHYEFDIHKNNLVVDCTLYPTNVQKSDDCAWLYARNNKYIYEDQDVPNPSKNAIRIDYEKVGKWMVFLSKDKVNPTWDQIKMAVTNGDLWSAKVSVTDPKKPNETHAIMIYTKDFTDLKDVVSVLDFLESSGIKPPNVIIKYKTDNQTRAGVYRGGKEKPWIYSSDTVRAKAAICYTYEFDLDKKEVVTECNLHPTEVSQIPPWLDAKNNKYTDISEDDDKVGKWLLPIPKKYVNTAWDKIKMAVTRGDLWHALVSTHQSAHLSGPPDIMDDLHIIAIKTKDSADVNDVIHVLDFLETSGIKPPNQNIKYMKGEESREAARNKAKTERLWIYTSNLIRLVGDSINDTFEYDIHKKELIADCILNPAETLKSDFMWLRAQNNKYPDASVDPKNVGKWMIFLEKDKVNAAWADIKAAVTNGELWRSSVTTTDPKRPDDSYAIMIHTKDHTDKADVIQVLDYLESSGIKPHNEIIKYKTEVQTITGAFRGGRERSWIYSSDTIRSMDENVGDVYEFDVRKKELVTDCPLYPTQASRNPQWLYARNNKYPDEIVDAKKVGKWELFIREDRVDSTWDQVKTGVRNGHLWSAKVSTFKKKNYPFGDSYTIAIYTKDSTNCEDVIQVLDHLESSGIKPPNANIAYKTDEDTHTGYREGVYHAGGRKPLYYSKTIRSEFKMDLPWR